MSIGDFRLSPFCSSTHLITGGSNVQSKSTGQLSGTVYVANFMGCIARIFTSLQEGGGYAMVRGFVLGVWPPPNFTHRGLISVSICEPTLPTDPQPDKFVS